MKCPICNGIGKVRVKSRHAPPVLNAGILDCTKIHITIKNCPYCSGIGKVKNIKLCKKINSCYKIKMIFDHDLLEFQYAEIIRKVCLKCLLRL